MAARILLLSLVLLPLPSLADTSVWQVWNSSSYCSNNTVIYSCVNSKKFFINWDIFDQGGKIASWGVSHFSERLTRESEPIEAVLEVTYSNSTSIASTIILTLPVPETYTIKCNTIIAENIPTSSLANPLPTTIEITVLSDTVTISWNITWDEYVIEEYSSSDEMITTSNIQINPFNLSTDTARVNISVCPNHFIHFKVESCLFNMENNQYIKKYFVYHVNNNTWELTGANSSKTIFTICNQNGSWENIEFFNQEFASTSHTVADTDAELDTTSTLLISSQMNNTIPVTPQNMQNITKQGYDTEDNPMDSNSTRKATNLATILVLSITPVGLVLLISSIILAVIPAGMWTYRKKSHDNRNLNIETEDAEVAAYEQLNNFPYHGSSSAIGTPGHQPPVMKLDSEQDYSTLKHIKQSLPPSMDYDTINGVKPLRYKSNQQLQYAEIHTCTQCGRAKSFEDYKVKYTNICTQEEMADEQLNLHTLSAQLGQISESFIAFGSVAGVSPASLSEIVVKSASHNESMTEVCDMWLKKCQQEQTRPTWHMVAEIVDLIGHKDFSKKLLEVHNKVQIDNSSPVVVPETKDLPLFSADTGNENHPGCLSRNDEESWSDEAPPVPPFNPQCLSGPESMPPLYEEVQVIALRPLASGNHPQSGPEDVTTFTGTSHKVSEAVGMENL